MIDISEKIETLRTATAESWILASDESLARVLRGDTPKGEVLQVARVAGILAAKKTAELIPYCHPLSLDFLSIEFEKKEKGLRITAQAKTIAKTGVEIEAMMAASIAALTVYDMMKAFDKEVVIGETRLVEKTGGKSDYVEIFPRPKTVAILISSDSVAAGKKEDRSGKILLEAMKKFPVELCDFKIVPDDKEIIRGKITGWIEAGIDLILSSGGTGLGPRDITVEVVQALEGQEVPGIAEAMRSFGQKRTPYAMLSRGLAKLCKKTMIITLPGSSNGVREGVAAIFPSVLHAFNMMAGGGH